MAKFMAQIEMEVNSVSSTSDPAAVTSPDRVRSSGSPAATSEPKAMTRMASVTGHEIISERIIASWLASLKSLQSTEAPVT